jgi:hypothetical protein
MDTETTLSASERLAQELTIATDASIGVIAVRCPETEVYRVVDEIYSIAQSQMIDFMLHSSETGWCTYTNIDPEDTNAPPFDALNPKETDRSSIPLGAAFEKLYGASVPNNGFFVMLDTYFTFGEMQTQTSIRKQAQRSLSNEQRLFLIVPNHVEIPEAVSPLVHVVEYGFPTREELQASLEDILESIEDDTRPELSNDEVNTLVSNGQGMTLASFEAACALSITKHGVLHGDYDDFGFSQIRETIREYKTQLLRKTNVLELQPNVPENEIGGLDLFKEWMHQRKSTYTDAAKEMHVTPSRGGLVVGPPGTGKSLVAKAAGSILGLPVVRFDVGRVFGQYMGQSEQAMRLALTMIDAMAPCVLMLDEIDKGFSGTTGGSNDSGTTMRVFGTFLTWMQERDQIDRPVFLILTANRVAGLPPELLRKGRIDEIWSVNVPNEEEREAIIKIHLKKRGVSLNNGDIKGVVRISDKLVGAEIEAMIEDALVLSLSHSDGFCFEVIEQARGYLNPMSETRADEFDAMKSWAKDNARAASTEKNAARTATDRTPAKGKRPRAKVKVTRPARDK